MKIKIELDLEDFTQGWDSLDVMVKEEVERVVLREVKKTKEWKDHVNEMKENSLKSLLELK